MKNILLGILVIFLVFWVSCKKADVLQEMEIEEESQTSENSTIQKFHRRNNQDVRFWSNASTYIIFPFEWNTNYEVKVKNKSKTKTYVGTIIATAYYRNTPLHTSEIEHITLLPKEQKIVIVYIRINRPCVFNPPPPPLPNVTSCLVTFR